MIGLLTSCQDGLTLGIRSVTRSNPNRFGRMLWQLVNTAYWTDATLGVMQIQGHGGPMERDKGMSVLKRACEQGFVASCENLETEGDR